jgi:hypothetical protein
MYFTRHARNRARGLGVSLADAEHVIGNAEWIDCDEDGLPRYTGYVGEFKVRIVIALDDPELIVTIHKRRK